MTNTTEIPARIIPETEAQIISQKLEYWDDGVSNFAMQASQTLSELQEKLKNPTRENLPGIRADIKVILETQRMVTEVTGNYQACLRDLKGEFNKTFTVLDVLRGNPEK
ncbi:MAG: hypothetical protein ACLR7M_01475 [Varibaculum timonense]